MLNEGEILFGVFPKMEKSKYDLTSAVILWASRQDLTIKMSFTQGN